MNITRNGLVRRAQELMKKGWTTVPFPFAAQLANPVVQGFANFLNEPQHIKDWWGVHMPGDPKPDDGYLRRDDNEHKDFFHYKPLLRPALTSRGVSISPHESFLDALERQHVACEEIMFLFLDAWRDVSGFDFIAAARRFNSRRRNTLRVLYYDPVDTGSVMAVSHTDRSFFTLCAASSRSGLRVGREMISPQIPVHNVLIFPGQRAEEMTKGTVRALEHLVIEDVEDLDATVPRWSQVFFFHIDSAMLR